MASHVIGPLATFDRPLVDEELPTLYLLSEWSISMDLLPARGTVELTTTDTYPRKVLSAPKLARRHEHNLRRDRV